ncbi:glycosyltransferase family 2 protein [Gluconacetobacter diazotrophicus]|uniref:Putative glycosyltransferase n=1 Tax=Gluconacetobacter diazotrophicus (strain ATCC 49037 / DSM 5601 / CCUG 37298 / CIP 103539 / LMG 7603 / PAl5) TaxID=272568 RepID=A9H4R2_GLUDA|nr:glycosyltransferase family 2 protein [Gluconacetobacter diazotrophicus]CAP57471.1 putative glycosyltransferase [Gluconacetobacter diazotrophicus PA1 5]
MVTQPDKRLFGQFLVSRNILTEAQLDEAIQTQKLWKSRLGDIILAKGWLKPRRFYHLLATFFDLEFVDLMGHPPDPDLFDRAMIDEYARRSFLPWRRSADGAIILALADPSEDTFNWLRARYGQNARFVGTGRFDTVWLLQKMGNAALSDDALNALSTMTPQHSARQVFTRGQIAFFYITAMVFLLFLYLAPERTLFAANLAAGLVFFASFFLKFMLSCAAVRQEVDVKVRDSEIRSLEDRDFPVYTILVPMYKEPDVLPILVNAIRNLEYPQSKLDVKLVLEEDDIETIAAARKLALEATFEIICVPPSEPRTKPKACNYALRFARGEYLTIYDAEDKPEATQLEKVLVAFRKLPDNVVCIQARLNYYNATENWLTRMFTLEYTAWFDFYLPALEYMRIPIPLGGTSNHFKISALRAVHAWDPYNVTEDADLGVRLTQRGWKVAVVDSTTFEEANVSIPNWIRQRSRWLKGYMQTYLVHMRSPLAFYRKTGGTGFWGFQFFIGGTFMTALLAPIFWVFFILFTLFGLKAGSGVFSGRIMALNALNLLLGNGFLVYTYVLCSFKRNYRHLALYALTTPVYWALQSIAAYKGLFQLLYKPFYWEKTQHGLSKHTAAELEELKS